MHVELFYVKCISWLLNSFAFDRSGRLWRNQSHVSRHHLLSMEQCSRYCPIVHKCIWSHNQNWRCISISATLFQIRRNCGSEISMVSPGPWLACCRIQARPASWGFFPPLSTPWQWLLQQHLMQVVLLLTWVLPALYISYFCWTFLKFNILSLWSENRKELSHKKRTRVVRCGIEDHVTILLGTGPHQFFFWAAITSAKRSSVLGSRVSLRILALHTEGSVFPFLCWHFQEHKIIRRSDMSLLIFPKTQATFSFLMPRDIELRAWWLSSIPWVVFLSMVVV